LINQLAERLIDPAVDRSERVPAGHTVRTPGAQRRATNDDRKDHDSDHQR
jgi:hypothetical protein